MSNLSTAAAVIEQSRKFEAIVSPQPKKRMKLPLQRDISLVQNTLNEKLDAKEKSFEQKIFEEAKAKWAPDVSVIHAKALNLRREIEALAATIEAENPGVITIDMNQNGYSSDYWAKLPQSIPAAEQEELLEYKDSTIPHIESLRKEIEQFVLNLKLCFAQLSDIKPLMEKIELLPQ